MTIADGTAYIGASDATFRATDIHTGKVIWTYTGVKGLHRNQAVGDGRQGHLRRMGQYTVCIEQD